MINRITTIIRRNSPNRAVAIFDGLISGAIELTLPEKYRLVEYLCESPVDAPLFEVFWLIAACLPVEPRLLAKARTLVMPQCTAESPFRATCPTLVLQYLLANETKNVQEALISFYAAQPSVRKREAVADHLISIDRVEEGLRLMVGILADVGTDHATTDSIAMSFSYFGNEHIRKNFLAEAARTRDKELQGNLEWAAGFMQDEHL